MNAVGINISKGKSMVAAMRPMGKVAFLPQEFFRAEAGLEQMAYAIIALAEDTRVIMEATGHYHQPVAAALHAYGLYVCDTKKSPVKNNNTAIDKHIDPTVYAIFVQCKLLFIRQS